MSKTTDPSIFIIFGAVGDLSRRKLLPSLCKAAAADELGNCHILGVGIDPHDDASFRSLVRESLSGAGLSAETSAALPDGRLHYHNMGKSTEEDYRALEKRLAALDSAHGLGGNHAFYLALPTGIIPYVVSGLGNVGLNESAGWTRLVVEKPFGTDLASGKKLNQTLHQHFREDQIYRIDHYLGKETVQNLLVFRLANAMIESVWNRDRVEAVQITHAEALGVGTRAAYYDKSGAMRDMVQNHLTQLLSLVAMEVPVVFDAESVRFEKIKALRSVGPISAQDVIFGQYSAGEIDGEAVPGYLEAPNIPAGSQTETFVAMKLEVNTWRWQGVPFYLRTGKRMPKRLTQIALRFRQTPVHLFESMGAGGDDLETADILIISLQPDEGFSFHFDVKRPGAPFGTERIPLEFKYSDRFEALPAAYRTLLIDVLNGDQTLFVHADEVEQSWSIYAGLLDKSLPVHSYPAGTWGPPEADHLAIPEKDLWQKA